MTGAPKLRKPRGPQGPRIGGGSREARQMAAAILEVLAGDRSPQEAASVLSVSLPRYYALETRAIEGLVASLEPRKKGKAPSPGKELDRLRREVEQLRRESARRQALLRTAQRTVGLAAPAPAKKSAKKRRRAVSRALRAAERLREEPATTETSAEGKEGGS